MFIIRERLLCEKHRIEPASSFHFRFPISGVLTAGFGLLPVSIGWAVLTPSLKSLIPIEWKIGGDKAQIYFLPMSLFNDLS